MMIIYDETTTFVSNQKIITYFTKKQIKNLFIIIKCRYIMLHLI